MLHGCHVMAAGRKRGRPVKLPPLDLGPEIRLATRHAALKQARAHVVVPLAQAAQVGQRISATGFALLDMVHHHGAGIAALNHASEPVTP